MHRLAWHVKVLQKGFPPRNIIRVDHEASHTHAWRVTLQRHNDIVVKMFSDSMYGGKRKALKAAEV